MTRRIIGKIASLKMMSGLFGLAVLAAALIAGTQAASALPEPPSPPVILQDSVSATAGRNYLNLSFSTTEKPAEWKTIVRQGRFDDRPQCAGPFGTQSTFAAWGPSGQYEVSGLKKNTWYTAHVCARYYKDNGNTQVFWRYIGKAQAKTNK